MIGQDILEIGDWNFVIEVENEQTKPVVVFFYSKGCKPCASFAPVFNKISQTHKQHFKFVAIDGNLHKASSEDIVKGYPTTVIFNKGKLISSFNGAANIEFFSQYINRNLRQIRSMK